MVVPAPRGFANWRKPGRRQEINAREIFLFQKLEALLATLVATVPEVDVEKVTVIDAGGGGSATKIAAFMEQLRQSTGLDLTHTVQRFVDDGRSQGSLTGSQHDALEQ
jgi:uncharacterized membrane protein YqiK